MSRTTIQITPKNTIISTNCFSLQNSLNSFCRSHPGLCQLRVSSVHGGTTYRIRKHSDFLYLLAIICNELKKELDEVRQCLPDRILFLDASDEVLREHKINDPARSRNFFEHHLQYMMPLKRKWFIGKENVDVLMVDDLSAKEVGVKVREWCDKCIKDMI